jgi:hypothetical protein
LIWKPDEIVREDFSPAHQRSATSDVLKYQDDLGQTWLSQVVDPDLRLSVRASVFERVANLAVETFDSVAREERVLFKSPRVMKVHIPDRNLAVAISIERDDGGLARLGRVGMSWNDLERSEAVRANERETKKDA